MVDETNTVSPLRKLLARYPKKVTILGISGLILLLIYVAAFFIPRPVAFSYAGKTCVGGPVLFSGLQKAPNTEKFSASFEGGWRIGDVPIVSMNTCFEPTQLPKKGATTVAIAPFGSLLFRSHFALNVPNPPSLNAQHLNKPIPTTKSLKLSLSETDRVLDYTLKSGGKKAGCKPSERAINCDIVSLGLEQGKKYPLTLERSFDGKQPENILSKDVETLTATMVTGSSIKVDENVFARPKTFTFTTDKPLRKASASLVQRVDGATKPVESKLSIDKTTVTVTIADELERNKDFTLKLESVEAEDGSALINPYEIPFHLSTGPKVTGVSVGKTGVGLSAQVVVSFDQPISEKQDVSKIIQFAGGGATITRSGGQVIFRLQNLPKCTDFTLTINKGLLSAHDIASTEAWAYTARTTCHTVSTIGYSQRGRAINAYYFGNGNSTVLYVGAIHGSERSSSLILQDWINELEVKARTIPANRQIVVVPTLNPDGYAAGSRNNARNVNLNRNFATNDWKKDIKDTNGTVAGGGGSEPMSEPETKAIANLSAQLRPRLVLSYHAVGSVVIGNEAGDSSNLAARYASAVGYNNGTGNSGEIFDYEITGTYDDWLAQKLGVPSMIVELGSYSYRNFGHHRSAFWMTAGI